MVKLSDYYNKDNIELSEERIEKLLKKQFNREGEISMNNLIKEFNTERTHVEFDVVNQCENGTSKNKYNYTYTAYLIDNETGDPAMGAVSIDNFEEDSINFVRQVFSDCLILNNLQ